MLKHYIIQTTFTDRYELDADYVSFQDGFVIFTIRELVVGAFFQPAAVICTPIAN